MNDHLMNFVDEEKEKNYIIILQTFLESLYSLYNYVINQIKEIIIHSINYKRYNIFVFFSESAISSFSNSFAEIVKGR